MVMPALADLHELNSIAKVIHDRLVPPEMPPFDCVIVFAPGNDDPIWKIQTDLLCDNGCPGAFFVREANVSAESCWSNCGAELLVEIIHKAPKEVRRNCVARMNQRVMTF